MSCGSYTKEDRQLKRQILVWKQKQRLLREEWLLLDIKINCLEHKVSDLIANRITKKRLSK